MTSRPVRSRLLEGALLLSILSGCAALSPPATAPAKQAASVASSPRAYFNAIDINGRLSLRYQHPRTGNEEVLHGSFSWTQHGDYLRVTLLSPLGQTIAVIETTPQGATLTQTGQAARWAPEVDSLIRQELGWPLPVSGLREWLQGFGIDASGQRFIATPEATQFITQDNWRIDYVNWQQENSPASPSRPRRIDLERYTPQAGNVSIRIVLDSWQPR